MDMRGFPPEIDLGSPEVRLQHKSSRTTRNGNFKTFRHYVCFAPCLEVPKITYSAETDFIA